MNSDVPEATNQGKQEASTSEIKYLMYWLVSGPHCDAAKPVRQVDGKTAWVCRHEVNNLTN